MKDLTEELAQALLAANERLAARMAEASASHAREIAEAHARFAEGARARREWLGKALAFFEHPGEAGFADWANEIAEQEPDPHPELVSSPEKEPSP